MTDTPNLFTIPAGVPFLDALAAELWDRVGRDPVALSRATILLPTNRAIRAAEEAFLRLGEGRPMLLPSLRPLADIEDEALDILHGGQSFVTGALSAPPAISGPRRQLLLTRLILELGRGAETGAATPDQAARLATALARLIDEVQTQDLDFAALETLVPERYADHWQQTLDFLRIVTRHWPAMLEEAGLSDPKLREFSMMRVQAEVWRHNPPTDPVIVAGSTGSVPATAELMSVVARLPQGSVVLPGLDQESDEPAWRAIFEDPAHPQHGMARLLDTLGVVRADVRPWGTREPAPALSARLRLIREAMRPAATTDAWRRLSETAPDLLKGPAFIGLGRVEAPTQRQEAGAIAVALREVAEMPGRTAALITADRTLARRVKLDLERWGLTVDDSGGMPLAESPVAVFLSLITLAVTEGAAPVPLLSLLKHSLIACEFPKAEMVRMARLLERRVLRGPRPGPGLAGLMHAVQASVISPDAKEAGDSEDELVAWTEEVSKRLEPLFDVFDQQTVPPSEILDALVNVGESLAATVDQPGDEVLWAGDTGEMLAGLVADLRDSLAVLPPIKPREWHGLFQALLEGRMVRPRNRAHPRIQILGALEARLQRFDRVILGGLAEGSWPRQPEPDPWMSRPMRESFGLPPHERRIGLSAHDFTMAMTAEEVILTRSLRVDGAPSVPSRWWRRLETVVTAVERDEDFAPETRYLSWAAMLDRPDAFQDVKPPAPKPPSKARPTALPVTQIQTWLEDPYAIYARRILNLKPLLDLDAEPGPADRGTAIHDALDALIHSVPSGPLPPNALEQLLDLGRETFEPLLRYPTVWAFWWPRFERVAAWFVETEAARREHVQHAFTEQEGSIEIEEAGQTFRLFGRADRIDLRADNSYALIDYKTGQHPKLSKLKSGEAPQLPLEALMLQRGGFSACPPGSVGELAYWRLTGDETPGRIDAVDVDIEALIEEAEAGLRDLIGTFTDENTPYHAIPNPARAPRFNDYEDLARVLEWSGEGDGDG